ncbi:hypothetical protein SLS62_011386 [Diatrype stigma]|uniref:protein S-acyltransferase n=1 Tax=Diatrype stigma TaxID=117547 RepID=A0AAN9U4C6_9PEZI
MLIKRQGTPNDAETSLGKTAFHTAIRNGLPEVAKLLWSAGADVDLIDNEGMTPIQEAGWQILTRTNSQAHRDALQSMFDTTMWSEALELSLLHKAVVNLLPGVNLEEFIRVHKSLLNVQDATLRTPLHWAAETADENALDALLVHHADTSIRDCFGDTPLMKAVKKGSMNCIKKLLVARADPTVTNNLRETTLHLASRHSVEMIDLLRSMGVPFSPSIQNLTPLDWAAITNNVEVGRHLISLGVDVNFPDGRGHTTIFHATICWGQEFARMLLGLPQLDLSVLNHDGETVLHVLARHGDIRGACAFLDAEIHGLDPDVVSSKGETASEVFEVRLMPPVGFDAIFQRLVVKLRDNFHSRSIMEDIFFYTKEK